MQSDTNERLNLQDLAPELLEHVFIFAGIADASGLAACAATCCLFRNIIYQVGHPESHSATKADVRGESGRNDVS